MPTSLLLSWLLGRSVRKTGNYLILELLRPSFVAVAHFSLLTTCFKGYNLLVMSYNPYVKECHFLLFVLCYIFYCFILDAKRLGNVCLSTVIYLRSRFIRWLWASVWTKPTSSALLFSTITDLPRSKHDLIVENAMLRQQLIVLRRQVKRPQLTSTDRVLLVLLASRLRTWKSALLIVQPDTLLRWHRLGFRLLWKRKSRANSREPRIPAETVKLITQMVQDNRLWGAERIRGELLKLDVRVCKRTIQKYMRQARRPKPSERNFRTGPPSFIIMPRKYGRATS